MNLPREIDSVLLLNPTEEVIQWWDDTSTFTGDIMFSDNNYHGFFVLTNQSILFVAKMGLVFANYEMKWRKNLDKIEKLTLHGCTIQINDFLSIMASEAVANLITKMIKDERNKFLLKMQDVKQSTPYIQQSQPISQPTSQPTSSTNLKICPYCGKDLNLNLPKPPKFCPYCREQIS